MKEGIEGIMGDRKNKNKIKTHLEKTVKLEVNGIRGFR